MEDHFMLLLQEQSQRELLRKTNDYAEQFGLHLEERDIQELLNRRRESLALQNRIEFGNGILEKIIMAFCDSDFIFQDNYAESMARLQDIFYLYKNEAMDEWTDEELIDLMREAFDGECMGSFEYLEDTYLERFARDVRAKTRKFIGRYSEDDEEI